MLKYYKKFNLLVEFAEAWRLNSGNSSEELAKIGKLYNSIKDCESAAAIFLKLL